MQCHQAQATLLSFGSTLVVMGSERFFSRMARCSFNAMAGQSSNSSQFPMESSLWRKRLRPASSSSKKTTPWRFRCSIHKGNGRQPKKKAASDRLLLDLRHAVARFREAREDRRVVSRHDQSRIGSELFHPVLRPEI